MKKIIIWLFVCFVYSHLLWTQNVLDDFSEIKWKFTKWDAIDGKVSLNKDIVKDSKYSMEFEYLFEKVGATCLEWSNINGNWEKEEGIGFWIYGDNSRNNLIFRIFTSAKDFCSSNRVKIDWDGWKYIYIPKKDFFNFGNGIDWKKISFMYIVLEHPSDAKKEGKIYFGKIELKTPEKESSNLIPLLKNNSFSVFLNENRGAVKITAESDIIMDNEVFWKVYLMDIEKREIVITPENIKPEIFTDMKSCSIKWKKFFDNNQFIEIICKGKTDEKKEEISLWEIEVKNSSNNIIRYVEFPRFSINDDNGNLVIPVGKGMRIKSPSKNQGLSKMVSYYGFDAGGGYYPCSLQTMQFFIYYNDKEAFYFATHDSNASMKQFRYLPDGKKYLNFILKIPVENMKTPGNSYVSKYETIIGLINKNKGDWYSACLIYRDWAIKQIWCQKGPTYKRKDIPEWFKNTSFWLSSWLQPKSAYYLPNYYPELVKQKGLDKLLENYVEPSEYVIKFKKYFDPDNKHIMGFQWYAWNIQSPWYMEFPHYGQKYDPNFPELAPHKETPQDVLKMKKENIYTIPYVNTYLWEKCVPSYEKAKLYAVKNENGDVKTGYYRKDNEGKGWENVAMCPYTEWYQNIQAELLSNLLKEVKFYGLYLDQITAVAPQLCFDQSHGHPVGGGSWWVEGYRKLIEKVREQVRKVNPESILTSEANTEPFIDLLDGNLAITCTFADEVPLYKIVYGDYTILYGRKPSPQMLREKTSFSAMIAQSFVYGEQIGWFSVGEVVRLLLSEDFKEEAEYMKKAIEGLKFANKFLISGIYQKPIKIEIYGDEKDVKFKQSLAGYTYDFTLPSILHSVYKSYDNQLCLVFTNYTESEKKIKFELNPYEYGIDKNKFKLKTWIDGDIKEQSLDKNLQIEKNVKPKSIEIYLIY